MEKEADDFEDDFEDDFGEEGDDFGEADVELTGNICDAAEASRDGIDVPGSGLGSVRGDTLG